MGPGHWGREQCAWHKYQKSLGRPGTQADTSHIHISPPLCEMSEEKKKKHNVTASIHIVTHWSFGKAAAQKTYQTTPSNPTPTEIIFRPGYPSINAADVFWSASFPSPPTRIFLHLSFILKLFIPLSPTLLAALFITCNHNNLSFLCAKQKESLSQGVFVPRTKRIAPLNETFISLFKDDVTFNMC